MSYLSRFRLVAVGMLATLVAAPANAQTDFFWNGANIAASPAAGGTGTWDTANAWRTVTDTGTQGTWAAGTTTNNAILAGSAGTITLGASGSSNFTGTDITVNTSGYIITSTSSSRNLRMTGTLTLADSVALTLNLNNTNGIWAFGDLSLGSGSSLTVQGVATANNANRVNLTVASGISSGGSITLAGTAAGTTGFVATAAGVTLNSDILNNSSTSATMLGATSGNSLTFGGELSGSANLQISAGQSGGAGTVILSSTNSYTGNTFLNAANNAVLRIGVDDALPNNTTVFFGASAGGGTADTGGSIDLNGFDLTIGGLENATVNARGVANNTGTLSTLTIGKASGTNTFGGVIGVVTNSNLTTQTDDIALVKTGASIQVLTGANTYTGGTTINGGTLQIGGADNRLATTGVLTLGGGTFSTGATTGFNQMLDELNFGSSSAISFGSGTHSLTFATINDLSGGSDVFTINGWTGNETGGTAGQFIVTGFGNNASAANTALNGFLSKVQFTGYQVGGGATFIASGSNVQLVPVPEPATMLALGAAGLGAFGYVRHRRNS